MCAIVAPMRAAQAPTPSTPAAMDRTRDAVDLSPVSPHTHLAAVSPPTVRPRTHLAAVSPPALISPRTRSASAQLARRIALLPAFALALACAPQPESNAPPSQASAPVQPTRTANNDARGAGMQPDYAGEAEALRQHIAPRLPAPLPSERRTACTAMLDAAVAFYGDIEPDPAVRSRLLADLASTRAADLTQCEQTTSVRAATCVQLRLADRDAELPWLLDQCTRAFPE